MNHRETLRALSALTGQPWSRMGRIYHAEDYSLCVAPVDPRLRTDTLKWCAEDGLDTTRRLGRTPVEAVRGLVGAMGGA